MMHDAESAWPPLAFARWAPTKRTIHLIAQMLGKLRLALAPLQSNFLFTALFLTPSGFTTGPIPVGARLIEAEVDLLEARITVRSSDGRRSDVAFTDLPSIAGTYEAFLRAVAALDVEVTLSPIPQEIPDQTPLDRDGRPPTYVAADARSWLTVACATHGAFDRWRAHFHGRTGLQLWWGAFDVSLLLFSGRRVAPPADRGYLFKYDLDAEMMSAGFYVGDDANAPFFYAYIYPEPPGCAEIALGVDGATWSTQLREWVLPYDAMRAAAHPEQRLAAFLDAIYGVCCAAGGWDRERYVYAPPPLRHAPPT